MIAAFVVNIYTPIHFYLYKQTGNSNSLQSFIRWHFHNYGNNIHIKYSAIYPYV